MGRTDLTLKPFVDECLQKGYINFRKKDNLIEIVTPQYKRKFDPQYEEIFKMYEQYCGREYISYVKSRGALIQALKKSKFYELLKPRPKHKYEFREKSSEEINNMSIKKKEKKIVNSKKIQKKRVNSKKIQKKREDTSPLTSGYESAGCSPGIQNPISVLSPSHILVQPDSDPFMLQIPENIENIPEVFQNSPNFSFPDIDDLDINMEEMESIKLSDEQFEKWKEDILSDGVSSDELNKYLPNEDQSSDNIAECYGKSQDGVSSDELNKYLPNEDQSSDNIAECYGKSQGAVLLIYMMNEGQIVESCLLALESAGLVAGATDSLNICAAYGNGQAFNDFGLTGQINPYNGNLVPGNDGQILKDFGLTGQINPYNGDPVSRNDGQILKGSGADQVDLLMDHTYSQQP